MHRFFVSPDRIHAGRVYFTEEQAHQIGRVLRLRPGNRVIALDDQGWEYEVVLERIVRHEVDGRIVARRPAHGEPHVHVTLYQAMLKGRRFELVLQKGTELGVGTFVPVVTARTVVGSLSGVSAGKWQRWQRIVTEAAEQSRRGRRPTVEAPLLFDHALSRGERAGEKLFIPWVGPGAMPARQALATLDDDVAAVGVLVGPEGGFAPEEVERARSAGAVPISLGPRVLRAETAAIVAVAVLLYELGEWEARGV
ncbi:MAG: RsmE family RNA methyltransferase [Ardenticatenia bacterium]|nr:RsmE family RNA methyltransferase [Ardenticatenia bacterium]